MHLATCELVEIFLENGGTGGRILCPPNIIPQPGQYLQASTLENESSLPVSVFPAGLAPGGLLLAAPLPREWQPGSSLSLRGPLGRGFSLPTSTRRLVLASLVDTVSRLLPLVPVALEQKCEVVLLSQFIPTGLPTDVEVRTLEALPEVCSWADTLMLDVTRALLPGLRETLGMGLHDSRCDEAQVLVYAPMPCGGLAECGVCALPSRRGWKMACKAGPVFRFGELGI